MNSILFSSTRQYNPGDEFILMGLENLLQEAGIKYNAVIANRNPMVDKISLRNYKDNSFDFSDWDLIDYVIFAGSPVWWQANSTIRDIIKSFSSASFINTFSRFVNINNAFVTDSIHTGIHKFNKRCSFLGVGSGRNQFNLDNKVCKTMKNYTDLLIVRNQKTLDSIPDKYSPILKPCPALYSSLFEKNVNSLKKILFILQGQNMKMKYDGLPENVLKYSLQQYAILKKYYKNVKLACFSWQDYTRLSKLIPKKQIIYHFRAEKWPDIMSEYDLVISTRVHGCGLASSLGIPNIMLSKGFRTETTELFLTSIASPSEDVLKLTKSIDLQKMSIKLKNHKLSSKQQWLALIKNKLSNLIDIGS